MGLAVATKVALLAVLAGQSAAGVLSALLAAHAVSRFWALGMEEGTHRNGLVVGGLWCLPALLLMVLAGGMAFMLAAVVASGIAFAVLRRRQRAWPDEADGVHAAQQACEVAFYPGAACALRP
ncbi:hypothetical protein HK414_25930 [Ramlibacter terrae]|uniref:Uncharacterized protein n=1 Tax=Ramlibacter terrae TaxID=2732511 RepID=A0ABX6P6Y9_9BURK|nr:hypothetical protein HK414_25930 [Ramlibacter terrae]